MTTLSTKWRIDLQINSDLWTEGKVLDIPQHEAEAMYKRLRDQPIDKVRGVRLIHITEHVWESRAKGAPTK